MLPWALKEAVTVAGQLTVRAVLVPVEPIMVVPAREGCLSIHELSSSPPRRCTAATSLHGSVMQACSMAAQLSACSGQACAPARALIMAPGLTGTGTADLPVKVVGAFMRRALAVPACPIWTVEYTVKTALLPVPLPKVLAPACGFQEVTRHSC